MKREKLLEKLAKLTRPAERIKKKQVKKLREVLAELKEKEDKLREQLQQTAGKDEQRKIQQKIEVIRMQREKGVEVYRQQKQARAQERGEIS